MRQNFQTVKDFENALALEFRADGHDVFEEDGVWFARVVGFDPTGEQLPVRINITKYAIGLERRFS